MGLVPSTITRTRRFVMDVGQYGLMFGPFRRAFVESRATHWDELQRLMLCYYGRRLWQAGFIAGRAGNLSARGRDPDDVFITPRGKNKARLAPSDIHATRLDDPPFEQPEVSVEFPMHQACYRANDDIGAVIHSHAPALTALGLRNLAVHEWLPEAADDIGGVGVVPFRESGSFELGGIVGETMSGGARLVILKGHGVVSAGANLADAFDRMELAELSAKTVLLAAG